MRRTFRMRGVLAIIHHSLLASFFLLTIHRSLLPLPAQAQGVTPSSVITTVAGNGRVFRGDGGPATSAAFGGTGIVAVDAAGNVYTTDGLNNLVLKITPDGVIRVVAGNNIRGYSGDDGPATSASFNLSNLQGSGIGGLAVDAAGNLYISDTLNHRIRKVTPEGVISTFAGTGRAGFAGDGGPAASARLLNPAGLLLDRAGNLYVADFSNQRIRKIGPDGIISTVAGNGTNSFSGDGGPATSASLNQPTSVALDASGNLYIADRNNLRVRKVGPNGIITTVGGNGVYASSGDGGPVANASFTFTLGVAVDEIGNLYIAEGGRIRKVAADGIISTVAGGGSSFPGDGGPATRAALGPSGVVAVTGTLYIGEGGRVRKVTPDGIINTIAGIGLTNFAGDGEPAHLASLSGPAGLAVDAAGTLFIADQFNNRVRKLGANGTIATAAGTGTPTFSGDGGPATNASLNQPRGVAMDASGNLFIVDGNNVRIRKVDVSGKITTVAGGRFGFSGDGGPATSAALNNPEDVAIDPLGNFYIADRLNYRIRKVDLAGVITTVAGNGNIGFSGDGGPAVNASLNVPNGVALDASGNLYIADSGNSRIRKVSPDGIILTVAGGGTLGDGVPATSARFDFPTRVTVDLAGNLFIVDLGRHEIRKVSPDGIITTIAGGTSGFSGDGGPARNASVNYPNGIAVDRAGNIYVADTGNDRVRVVLAAPPSFAIAPASLSFTVRADSGEVAPQQITLSSSAIGLAWTAQVSTQSGGNWLSVSPSFGTMPNLADIRVDAANLTPGAYRGTVTIVAALAAVPIQTVTINLTVGAAAAARLIVEPAALAFETLAGASSPNRTLRISNAGGGSLAWTARAESDTGGNWLSVAPASGSVSPSIFSQVRVAASSAALTAGFYSGAVIVSSSSTGETLRVPVNLLISQSRQTMLLSQSGLLFTGVEGGGVIPGQTFGVLNTGEGVMSWTAQASTLSGGNWLTVSSREGATDAASLQVPLVDVGVNVTGLAAGQYSGLVRVNAPTASNSPQFVTVELNVLPRGSNPGPQVRPTGLIFAAQTGTSSPGSQTVSLSTITSSNVDIVSGLLTNDGGNWLEALPRNLTLSVGAANQRIVVQPTLGSFAPGVYRGALTLLPLDGSSPQVVSLLFLVVRQTGSVTPARGAQSGLLEPQSHSACVPTQLFATHRTLGTNFSSPVGWPSTIEAQVVDDCGHAVPDAIIVARFSNGDPQVVLTSLRNGIYVGTWRPATPAAQVVVTVRAELPPLAAVEVQALGSTGANAAAPAVFAGGIVNTASYGRGEGLAPGSIVSVFGRNLARGENPASQLPLETVLGGARLSVGSVDVPLFYAGEGQINAQLPFDLPPNTRQVVVLRTARDNGAPAYAVPETITITSARPAIFTINQGGTGQGAILNQNFSPNSATNAAARGSVIQVFATGLGATNPIVPSGQPAPGNPPALVTATVEARLGGQSASVQFAGLAAGFVGLYQVNIVVPPTVQPGFEVELTLTQNGVPSNTVTVAVQ